MQLHSAAPLPMLSPCGASEALCHRCIGRIDFDIMQRSIERVREGASGDIDNCTDVYSMHEENYFWMQTLN